MLKHRIIPIVLIDGFSVLKTIKFDTRRNLGSPITVLRTYETRNVDELILLDINASLEDRYFDRWLVEELSSECFMPLTIGGGIKSCRQIEDLLSAGADKVSINTSALTDLKFINEAVVEFGSQCIVVAIDAKQIEGQWKVHLVGGKEPTDRDLFEWAKEVEQRGAGELLFTSMDHDGTKQGFANEALARLSVETNLPVIASGGAGNISHFSDAFTIGKADAALAASVFHFGEIAIPELKNKLKQQQIAVRIDK